MPSAAFTGAAEGYVFKMGPKGLGYYQDTGSGDWLLQIRVHHFCTLRAVSHHKKDMLQE